MIKCPYDGNRCQAMKENGKCVESKCARYPVVKEVKKSTKSTDK